MLAQQFIRLFDPYRTPSVRVAKEELKLEEE
jgi:hypothetical protein